MNNLIWTFGFVCLIFRVNGASKDEHRGLRKICFDEIGFTEDERTVSGGSAYLQNPKAGCYLKCILENRNLFTKDGALDPELAINALDEEIREPSRPLINKCVSEAASIVERCEKSFVAVKCLHEGAGEGFHAFGLFEPPKDA